MSVEDFMSTFSRDQTGRPLLCDHSWSHGLHQTAKACSTTLVLHTWSSSTHQFTLMGGVYQLSVADVSLV